MLTLLKRAVVYVLITGPSVFMVLAALAVQERPLARLDPGAIMFIGIIQVVFIILYVEKSPPLVSAEG